MKTDHFKLELTNRSSRITIFSNVDENFAQEYRESLAGENSNHIDTTSDIDFDNMTPAMRTVLQNASKKPRQDAKETPKKQNKAPKEFTGKYHEYNYKKRLKNRAEKFRTLAHINFRVPNVQFVTLTFDPNNIDYATDLKECHHAFQMFIKRIRRRYSDFMYLAVFSRQKNDNWHYHMLCNFDVNVKNKVIQDLWQNGMTHSTPLLSYSEFDSRVSYCIDNMYKVAWTDLQGENGYLPARGLQTPTVIRTWKDSERDMAYDYLGKILNSTDKPLDIRSELLEPGNDSDTASRVSYKISHKVFNEFFENIKIAKPKRGAVK